MDQNDKEEFAKKLAAIGRVMSRTITRDDLDAMFQFLKDYPLKIILIATDKALKDRPPDDLFLRTAMITGVEISQAADELLEREPSYKVGCDKCGGTGWVVDGKPPEPDRNKGRMPPRSQAIAQRCECLIAAIRAKGIKGAKK